MTVKTTYLSAGLAAWIATLATGCGSAEDPETGGAGRSGPPNIVLITLDTTRADHLGCYGYERETSPNIDRLAAEAVVYERAFSTTSWTLPAHASLFTGKFTSSHGARYDPEGPLRLTSGIAGPDVWNQYRARGLAVDETTLAMSLSEAGYATGAVVAGPWMKTPFGLNAGFDHYDDEQIDTVSGRLAVDVTDAALAWVASLERSTPFFLFLNYYDPHGPFGAPAPHTFEFMPPERHHERAIGNRKNWLDLYDGEILYTDLHVGRLFDGLRDRGALDNSFVVITADHGELFGEHGLWGHGESLSQEELHVPMIVKHPFGAVVERRTEPIQLVDVPALLLSALDLPGLPGMQGGGQHPVIAEVYPLELFVKTGHWQTMVEWPHKYMWNSKQGDGLFDLDADPGELRDLSKREPDLTLTMRADLEAYLNSLPQPGAAGPEADIPSGLTESLRNLGYMDGLEDSAEGADEASGD